MSDVNAGPSVKTPVRRQSAGQIRELWRLYDRSAKSKSLIDQDLFARIRSLERTVLKPTDGEEVPKPLQDPAELRRMQESYERFETDLERKCAVRQVRFEQQSKPYPLIDRFLTLVQS